jgi:asparagine synthase (glutamine-hydrolysing)
VAQACGLEHRILRLGSDFFSKFASHADRTIYATDGCLGILGAHEIYLNRLAREMAPVRLTGVFGGELLRDVSMFKRIELSPGLLNAGLNQSLQLPYADEHPVTFAIAREVPWQRFGPPAAARSQLIFRTPYLDNEIVELAYRAPEVLRTSSRSAVRLIRENRPALGNIPTDMGELGKDHGWGAPSKRIISKATCATMGCRAGYRRLTPLSVVCLPASVFLASINSFTTETGFDGSWPRM